MNPFGPIVSILRKDLIVHRWEMVSWFAACALLVCITAFCASRGFPWRADILGIAITCGAPVVYLLTLSVLREDPASDGESFWVTRPIAPWQMLLAKCAAIVLVAWLPALAVAVPWWFYVGLDGSDMLQSLETVCEGCALLSLFACTASFFVKRRTSLVLVFLLHLVALALFFIALARLAQENRGASYSGFWSLTLSLAELACLVSFVHYRLARRRSSGLVVIGASALLLVYATRFPNEALDRALRSNEGASALGGVRCEVVDYSESEGKVPYSGRGRGSARVSGLGAGQYLAVDRGRLEVLEPANTQLRALFPERTARAEADDSALFPEKNGTGDRTIGFEIFVPAPRNASAAVRLPAVGPLGLPAHPRTLVLRAPVLRVERNAECALVEKLRATTPTGSLVIEEIRRSGLAAVSVKILTMTSDSGEQDQDAFYVVAPGASRKAGVLPDKTYTSISLLGVRISLKTMRFDLSSLDRALPEEPGAFERRLAEFRLVRLRALPVGDLERTLSLSP